MQVEDGFKELTANNAFAEKKAIGETQEAQKEDIKAVITDANSEAKFVINEAINGDGELNLNELSTIYDHRTIEISEANKVHDQEIATISK